MYSREVRLRRVWLARPAVVFCARFPPFRIHLFEGLEFYAAARRLGKQVILLSYPDEAHHLGRRENQKDFQIRMRQFFDHYLKGAPAPALAHVVRPPSGSDID